VAGPASPAHREIVSYLAADWSSVKRQLDQQDRRVELYQERSNPRLADFTAFDLEAWWGRKLYLSLTTGV